MVFTSKGNENCVTVIENCNYEKDNNVWLLQPSAWPFFRRCFSMKCENPLSIHMENHLLNILDPYYDFLMYLTFEIFRTFALQELIIIGDCFTYNFFSC